LELRRGAGSRYPLLYQKAIAGLRHCNATSLQCLSAPRCFWYNATIEAILHGSNAVTFILFFNHCLNKIFLKACLDLFRQAFLFAV